MPELLGHDDSATAQRVTQALFGMKTIVIADLEAAAVYEPSVRRIASALFCFGSGWAMYATAIGQRAAQDGGEITFKLRAIQRGRSGHGPEGQYGSD